MPRSIRRRVRRPIALALAAVIVPVASWAQLEVYHSARDDGFDSGPAQVHGLTLVHVYAKLNGGVIGPNPGESCKPGTPASDEICQWAVRLTAQGGLVIADVAWGDAVEDDGPTSATRTIPIPK